MSSLVRPLTKAEELRALKIREADLARREKALKERELLPHRHLYPWYKWAWDFFTSTEHKYFLTAANQASKSSTQIRKCIEWATNKKLWPALWKGKPNLFWYFYPNFKTAREELETKWRQFLPTDPHDKEFGYTLRMSKDNIEIAFVSGVRVVFRAYSQGASALQAGSVYATFLDEECPEDLMPEISMRSAATNGYLHAVFTATLGQEYWRKTMEPQSDMEEIHKDAVKRQISLYDCAKYKDGSPSPWTPERIRQVEGMCGTKAEIDRRVHGKFVVVGGRKFEAFQRERDMCEPLPIPAEWHVYGGADYGSGGERGHPSAILFVACSPDYKQGRVFRGWRGDGIVTTAADLLDKYIEIRGKLSPHCQVYDHSARDFYVIASSKGETFMPADKSREDGTAIVNSLFKNEMLKIQRGDPELEKLSVELSSLLESTQKQIAKDDLCDVLRYICKAIPWNWSAAEDYIRSRRTEAEILAQIPVAVETEFQREVRERRGMRTAQTPVDEIDKEMQEWNALYEP